MNGGNISDRTLRSKAREHLRLAGVIWRASLLTLPLDLLLAQKKILEIPISPFLAELAPIFLLAALALSFREKLLGYTRTLQIFRRKLRALFKEYPWLLPAVFAALAMLEGITRVGLNLQGLIVGFVSLLAILGLLSKARRGGSAGAPSILASPAQALREAESMIFLIVATPALLARLASLLSALTLAGPEHSTEALLFFTAALIIIIANKPEFSDFVVTCPICSGRSPRAAIDLGFCFACGKNILFKDRKSEINAFLKDRKQTENLSAPAKPSPAGPAKISARLKNILDSLRP